MFVDVARAWQRSAWPENTLAALTTLATSAHSVTTRAPAATGVPSATKDGLDDKGEVGYGEGAANWVTLESDPSLRIIITRMTATISRVFLCDQDDQQQPVPDRMLMEEDGAPLSAMNNVFYISWSSEYKLFEDGKVVLHIEPVRSQRLRAPPGCTTRNA